MFCVLPLLSAAQCFTSAADSDTFCLTSCFKSCYNADKSTGEAQTSTPLNLPPVKPWMLDSAQKWKYLPTKTHLAWTWSRCLHSNRSGWCFEAAPRRISNRLMSKLGFFKEIQGSLHADISWCNHLSKTDELTLDSGLILQCCTYITPMVELCIFITGFIFCTLFIEMHIPSARSKRQAGIYCNIRVVTLCITQILHFLGW